MTRKSLLIEQWHRVIWVYPSAMGGWYILLLGRYGFHIKSERFL